MNSNQNTHWYKARSGWSANPEYANLGEIERVGFHNCSLQDCQEIHGASAEEFFGNKVIASQKEATRVHSSKTTRKAKDN